MIPESNFYKCTTEQGLPHHHNVAERAEFLQTFVRFYKNFVSIYYKVSANTEANREDSRIYSNMVTKR